MVAALALSASPAVGCLAETSWTDGTGSWFVAANWLNQQLPTVGIGAQINNGGTAQVNGPGAAACDLTVGFDATESGTVSVNSGSLAVNQEAEIGAHGKGTLTINNGGSVTAQFLTIAALPGVNSSGTVSVDGASSSFRATDGGVYVGGDPGGAGGIGFLNATNAGEVTAASVYVFPSGTLSGNGTVNITATYGVTVDGTLTPSGGTMSITGSGSLTLHSSAAMQSNVVPTSADNVHVSASGGAFLNGRLAVTMTGTFTPGTRYTLLTADGGRHGTTFSSVSIKFPTGQNFSPQIIYDTNHVYLYLASNTGP